MLSCEKGGKSMSYGPTKAQLEYDKKVQARQEALSRKSQTSGSVSLDAQIERVIRNQLNIISRRTLRGRVVGLEDAVSVCKQIVNVSMDVAAEKMKPNDNVEWTKEME
jgi:hypothetical protein